MQTDGTDTGRGDPTRAHAGAHRLWVYRLLQWTMAPGAGPQVTGKIASLLGSLPASDRLLDVGCGPASWLWRVGAHPVGIDVTQSYCDAFRRQGEPVVRGSADALPFANGFFGGVWSFGLLHHLPDEVARRALAEMVRVCSSGGYVVVFDGLLPDSILRNPVGWILRKLDRGEYMRTPAAAERLLDPQGRWACEQHRYSWIGLDGLWAVFRKG